MATESSLFHRLSTLTADLSWSCHINKICKKAKRHLGLIHRRFHQAPPQVRAKLYRSAVLPQLDYCSAVWDPHHQSDIQTIESVQKFAGRVATRQWKEDYQTILSQLNWEKLAARRTSHKLKLCYKIVNNLSIIPPSTFTPHPNPLPRHPHSHVI